MERQRPSFRALWISSIGGGLGGEAAGYTNQLQSLDGEDPCHFLGFPPRNQRLRKDHLFLKTHMFRKVM
jgi:hypothetical protein